MDGEPYRWLGVVCLVAAVVAALVVVVGDVWWVTRCGWGVIAVGNGLNAARHLGRIG